MARIDVGNDLTDYIIKPGWKVSDDGYGLRTATIQFTTDISNGVDFVRGEACPITGYEYLHLHKQTSAMDSLGMQIQTCDYVGIAPDVNEGLTTNPQISTSNGLTSENISTNPNFFLPGGDGYGDVIANIAFAASSLGPVVSYMDGATKKSRQSFVGDHGACFETQDGGRFIGFVDPEFKHFFGKSNYLAPTTSFSGHFYTNEQATVQQMVTWLGTTSYDNDWAGTLPKIVPTYIGTSFHSSVEDGEYDQLLLSQVNVEDFGDLYKVSYEVRYSIQGWPDEVYRKSSIMP
jgi:hypothetical protein